MTLWELRADQTSGEGLAIPALLGFELASNTTRQEAFEIANYMNKHIKGVYYAVEEAEHTPGREACRVR
jgi:hypothetical protein